MWTLQILPLACTNLFDLLLDFPEQVQTVLDAVKVRQESEEDLAIVMAIQTQLDDGLSFVLSSQQHLLHAGVGLQHHYHNKNKHKNLKLRITKFQMYIMV